MKKLILFILAAFWLSGGAALAVGTQTQTTTRTEVQERNEFGNESLLMKLEQKRREIQTRVETRKERIATKAAEVRARLTERKRETVRNYFGIMYGRFQAAILRLERIADRIEARLDLLEEQGLEVIGEREKLAAAREQIEIAKGLIADLNDEVEEILASETPKDGFEEVKETMLEVRDILKDIHRLLVEIITSIKKGLLLPRPTGEATTSANQ